MRQHGHGTAATSRLRFLYEAEHATAHRFRHGLLVFDVLTILFIVASSFLERTPLIAAIDVLLGLVILADFSARLVISRTRLRELLQPSTWADIVAISFLAAPWLGESAGTSCWRGCVPTAPGSGATKNLSSRISASSCL
jgi:voltage-gated potassium channel